MKREILIIALLLNTGTALASTTVEKLLQDYRSLGAGPFNKQAGEQQWQSVHVPKEGEAGRSCSDCHGDNLKQPGKHLRTGKRIEPMAPAVNPLRLTDRKQIEKWFKRNCRWTFGRDCTPQEKGDLMLFIQGQN